MLGWDLTILVPLFVLGLGCGVGLGLVWRFVQRPQKVEPKTQIIGSP